MLPTAGSCWEQVKTRDCFLPLPKLVAHTLYISICTACYKSTGVSESANAKLRDRRRQGEKWERGKDSNQVGQSLHSDVQHSDPPTTLACIPTITEVGSKHRLTPIGFNSAIMFWQIVEPEHLEQ